MQKQIFLKAFLIRSFTLASFAAMLSLGVLAQNLPATDAVDAIVQKAVDAKTIPGAGIAVVHDGKVILTKGYGAADVDGSKTSGENTAYQIASVTKQFTAAAIMLLVEDGKIKLDDPLGDYLADAPQKWRAVTVRQLLNQVSGIPNYTAGGKLVSEKIYAKSDILSLVADLPVEFAPGTTWKYSNTNYFLLGMIIEKVSGKSYPDFMKDRIFKPLKMNSTMVNTSGLKIENAALGYNLEKAGWQKSKLDDPSQPFAAGAIVSTPGDMAKWALALTGRQLLKTTSWDEAWTPAKLADGRATIYGFGWQIGKMGETRFVAHNGGISGFSSYIICFPDENFAIAALVNRGGLPPQDLALDIASLYIPKIAAPIAAQRAGKTAPPIEDTDQETTKFLRAAFEKMITGDVDPNLFTPEMQKILFPNAINQLKPFLSTQGPIKAFDLITADTVDGQKKRLYRVTFESGVKVGLNFTVADDGKIAGASVRPQ